MVSNYRHVGVIVTDMEKSIEFYCDLLGHKKLVDFTEKGNYFSNLIGLDNAEARVVKAGTPDGTFVELIQFTTHNAIPPATTNFNAIGCNHVCFTVDDIESLYNRMSSRGVKFVTRPLQSDFDPVKTCFCYDPDGTLIQFVEITAPIEWEKN